MNFTFECIFKTMKPYIVNFFSSRDGVRFEILRTLLARLLWMEYVQVTLTLIGPKQVPGSRSNQPCMCDFPCSVPWKKNSACSKELL